MTSLREVMGNVGGQRRLADTTLVVEQAQRANLGGHDLPRDMVATIVTGNDMTLEQ